MQILMYDVTEGLDVEHTALSRWDGTVALRHDMILSLLLLLFGSILKILVAGGIPAISETVTSR